MDNKEEMPLGLSFSLSMNEKAMQQFASLNETEKKQVVDEAKQIHSKSEMNSLVSRIGQESFR